MKRIGNKDLYAALYEKMAGEQAAFRDWLLEQTPEEILNHTYEYTVREDILMMAEDIELPDAQVSALLASPSPLADVYKAFGKIETGYMDILRECMEERAETLYQEMESWQLHPPLYLHPPDYAREHGELAQYRASHRANIECKQAIEQAIDKNFDGMYLNKQCVKDVLEEYGPDRMEYVLAATLQEKSYDMRFTPENRQWAESIPIYTSLERRCEYAVESHSAVLDGFVWAARKAISAARYQPEKKPSIKERLAAKLTPGSPPDPKPKEREAR